jgi:hypothetical protein
LRRRRPGSIIVEVKHGKRAAGALAAIAGAAGLLAAGCAHRERDHDVPGPSQPSVPWERARMPLGDVAGALEPCPPDFRPVSIRVVLSREWANDTCFAVVGRLTATYAESLDCNLHPVAVGVEAASGTANAAASPPSGLPRCTRGWVLTDVADPIVVRYSDDEALRPPSILVRSAGGNTSNERALLECNRDGGGKRIMPASTRLELPPFDQADIPRLNAGLADVVIGVHGGQMGRREMPDTLVDFGAMFVTHVCRMAAAPDGGAQAGG